MDKEVLQGWKEIEAYIGLRRETILKHGYPIHKPEGGAVYAMREELLAHALSAPMVKNRKDS